jgi:hypothetical protein
MVRVAVVAAAIMAPGAAAAQVKADRVQVDFREPAREYQEVPSRNRIFHVESQLPEAYATVNQLEYFAELSSMYFVGCNYQPSNRRELMLYDPTGPGTEK